MSQSPPAATAARPLPNLRWIIAGMLLLATTINYIDRQAISVAAPVISEEFNFSATDYSWIVSSFLLAYAVMQLVAGGLVDRVGARLGFSVAIVGWSIANMLHAFGTSVLSFSFYRFLLGAFEAANYPAALKVIAQWFPRSQRSTAVGILNVGPGLGAILAPPLIAWLILTVGWRLSFVITGAIGFFWLIAWRKLYFPPASHPRLSASEAQLIREGTGEPPVAGQRIPLGNLLRRRVMWGLILGRLTSDAAFYTFVFWLPKYLADERGFDIAQIGMFAWIPFLAADAGSLAGGWGGSRLIRAGLSLDASRKLMMWVGAAIVPLALPALWVGSPYLALFFIAWAMFGIQVKSAVQFTLPADLFAAKDVGFTWGISGAAGSLGAMAFMRMVGWLIDHLSYEPVFVIVSAMHFVSAAIIVILIRRIEPQPD
jgi:ACS family hexuronate transporter-like MFS transporter